MPPFSYNELIGILESSLLSYEGRILGIIPGSVNPRKTSIICTIQLKTTVSANRGYSYDI